VEPNPLLLRSGVEPQPTVTEVYIVLLYQPRIKNVDECEADGRMIGRENRSTQRNPPAGRVVHLKSHMT
jgi:hypothetical protein